MALYASCFPGIIWPRRYFVLPQRFSTSMAVLTYSFIISCHGAVPPSDPGLKTDGLVSAAVAIIAPSQPYCDINSNICNHFQLITDGALPGSHGCCSAVNSETGDARGNELTYERLSFRRSVEDANFNADTDLVWLSYRPYRHCNVWRNELSSLHSRLRVRRADLIDELASFAFGIKPGEVDCLSRGIFMPYSANQGLVYRFWSPHQIRAIFEREEPGGTFAAPHHRGQDDFATIVDAIFRDRDFFRTTPELKGLTSDVAQIR
ncbi:hypothetical protein KC323_g299 [Hortaea werneckii]|nr:hypothetical protein KC323_g299 [Hortaea werneckii]